MIAFSTVHVMPTSRNRFQTKALSFMSARSPPGPGRRRTLAMLATDPTNMMRTTLQLVSIRGGLLQEDVRGLRVKLTSKQKNQHWTGLKR